MDWDFTRAPAVGAKRKPHLDTSALLELASVTDCYTNIYISIEFTPSSATPDPTNDCFADFQRVLIPNTPEPTHQLIVLSMTLLGCFGN